MVSGNESFTSGGSDAADLTNTIWCRSRVTQLACSRRQLGVQLRGNYVTRRVLHVSLSSSKSVTLTTEGSDIDTVLACGVVVCQTAPSATPQPEWQ